jgi:predicted  nucleic acid-binding Zn-ribbon protein
MSGIKIKIGLPFFDKKEKKQIENIEFSDIKSYIEELRKEGAISEYYDKLKKSYETLIERLEKVKEAFENLENKGEKKFTSLVSKNLEKIKIIDEFDISSFQQFYTDTFYIIDSIIKIPARIQHEVLKYEDGKGTIELMNSFLNDVNDLKKILAMRYAEYSVVNHLENALKKHRELEDCMKRVEDIKKKIGLVTKEKEDTEKLFEERTEALKHTESRLDTEKVMELKEQIDSLNARIREIDSDLRSSLSRARRSISKILHSKGDKKIFEFFQNFMEYPLENINENFWEMVDILKFKYDELDEDENRRLNEFLKFIEDELKKKLDEYNNLIEEKKQLENILEKVSYRNKELVKKLEDEKKNVEEKLKIINRRLEKLEKEKYDLQGSFRKNVKTLEIIIKKASGNKIRIRI